MWEEDSQTEVKLTSLQHENNDSMQTSLANSQRAFNSVNSSRVDLNMNNNQNGIVPILEASLEKEVSRMSHSPSTASQAN